MSNSEERGRRLLTHQTTEGLESKSYGAILRRWLWLILLLAVVTVAVITYRSSTAPPVYQAMVELQVIAQEPEEVSLFTPLRGTGTEEEMRAVRGEFINILNSPSIARQTIAELNLGISARQLLDRLTVQYEDEFITVVMQAVGPQAAEALATAHVNNALEYYRQARSLPVEITEQFIADRLRESQKEFAVAEDAFLKFKLEYNVGSLHREIEAVQDVIRVLSQRRDEARVEMERYLALAEEMEREEAEALQRVEEAEARAVAAEETLRQAEEAEATEATEGTEEAKETEGETQEALKRAGEAELRAATATADHYRTAARAFEADAISHAATAAGHRTAQTQYEQIIARRTAELATLIGLSAEYDTLQNNLDQAQGRVSFLASKANEAEIKRSQALSAGYLQVIKPAQAPGSPLPANTWQLVGLGAVVSLIVGTFLAFLLEILSNRRHRAAPQAAK